MKSPGNGIMATVNGYADLGQNPGSQIKEVGVMPIETLRRLPRAIIITGFLAFALHFQCSHSTMLWNY